MRPCSIFDYFENWGPLEVGGPRQVAPPAPLGDPGYKQTLVIIPCSTSRPITGVYDGVFCEQGRNSFEEFVRNAWGNWFTINYTNLVSSEISYKSFNIISQNLTMPNSYSGHWNTNRVIPVNCIGILCHFLFEGCLMYNLYILGRSCKSCANLCDM